MRRVIIVTGAGRGIGLAIATNFALAGDLLVLTDLAFSKDAESIIALARQHGGDAVLIAADVASTADVHMVVSEAITRFSHVDVLINNAGILLSKATADTTDEEWHRVINVNLGGTWNFMRAVLPSMTARRSGRIINVSSELGLIGFPTYAAYCASKGGVIALTKAVAKEVAPVGILVNSVAPGPVETHMLKYDTVEFNDETREQIPLKRFGQPNEIAAAVDFLAGPGGTYMVGQVISPNGGTAI